MIIFCIDMIYFSYNFVSSISILSAFRRIFIVFTMPKVRQKMASEYNVIIKMLFVLPSENKLEAEEMANSAKPINSIGCVFDCLFFILIKVKN